MEEMVARDFEGVAELVLEKDRPSTVSESDSEKDFATVPERCDFEGVTDAVAASVTFSIVAEGVSPLIEAEKEAVTMFDDDSDCVQVCEGCAVSADHEKSFDSLGDHVSDVEGEGEREGIRVLEKETFCELIETVALDKSLSERDDDSAWIEEVIVGD